MPLERDTNPSDYQINAFEPGRVTINETVYTNSLIIGLTSLIPDWPPRSLAAITPAHLATIIELKPAVVILGTGERFHVPERWIIDTFHRHRIGFEFMDTGAACRTFVALSSEGREVVAGLLMK